MTLKEIIKELLPPILLKGLRGFAQLIYKPYDFMNIRFAAYKGLSRPDFNYRLPTYVLVGASSQTTIPEVRLGNSNLKNEEATNYEINCQFFGNKIGLFSIAAYYKEIKNN